MHRILPSWRETLLCYLEASNEDSLIISYFQRCVVPSVRQHKRLIWLDIGPGPGTKTFGIYETLLHVGDQVIYAQAIEPDPVWRGEFSSRANDFSQRFPRSRPIVLSSASLHDLSQPPSGIAGFREPNFITCIHVLYEPSLVQDLGAYLAGRRHYCACLIVEAPSSAFCKLRKTITATLGIGVPLRAENAVRKMLNDRKIKYREDLIAGQICQVRSVDDIEGWLIPFLLGVSPGEIGKMRKKTVTSLTKLVKEYVASHNWVLQVPDIAFHIENG